SPPRTRHAACHLLEPPGQTDPPAHARFSAGASWRCTLWRQTEADIDDDLRQLHPGASGAAAPAAPDAADAAPEAFSRWPLVAVDSAAPGVRIRRRTSRPAGGVVAHD